MTSENVSHTQVKMAMKLLASGMKWKDVGNIVGVEWLFIFRAIRRYYPDFKANKRRGRPPYKKTEFSSDEEKRNFIDDYLYRKMGVARLSKKYGFSEKRTEVLLCREGVLRGTGRKYWNVKGVVLRDKLNLGVIPNKRKTKEMSDAGRDKDRDTGKSLEF